MPICPIFCGRLLGRRPTALRASSHRPLAAVLVTALLLSACGGGDTPAVAAAPTADPSEFADGLLVSSSGASNYAPLLQLAGHWQRCDNNGAQYNLTVAVGDEAAGTLQLQNQFVDYFADSNCGGTRVARAERVVSGSTTPLEIAVGYTGGTFMSRDYVLPPTNQAADTVFWRVTYTAPAHVLRLTDPASAGTAFTTKTISGQPHRCFDRLPLAEVCLPDVPAAAQSANSWRAIHLKNAAAPDAMYLFSMLPQRPPAVLETWYLRQPI